MVLIRSRRAGALLLVLWLTVSLVERAVPMRCPLHDLGFAPAAMAHHGAHGSHGGAGDEHESGGTHQCHCLEQCAASVALALPGEPARAPLPPAIARATGRTTRRSIEPARVDTRLPFANGPPHALGA